MSKDGKVSIEPMGLRRRQGCLRWLMMLVLIAVTVTMVAATALVGF